MTLRLDRVPKGSLDAECVWLVVFAATAVVGAAWLLSPLPTPACWFHTLTGQPCPTCGGTRCIRSLLDGNLPAAVQWNPLVAFGAVLAAAWSLYALVVIVLRLPRVRVGLTSPLESRALRVGVALAVVANWIYLVLRFSGRI